MPVVITFNWNSKLPDARSNRKLGIEPPRDKPEVSCAGIAERRGMHAALAVGYFKETLPWTESYEHSLGRETLRAGLGIQNIVQYSGAFWPFHEGHLETLQSALDFFDGPCLVIVHVDHGEYRQSKGNYDTDSFKIAFELLKKLRSRHVFETRMLFEDQVPKGCSRNFTRLYAELTQVNPQASIWFLAGGDRAAFCMAFLDKGSCLVVGRDQNPEYTRYVHPKNNRLIFLPGRHPQSSSSLRAKGGQR